MHIMAKTACDTGGEFHCRPARSALVSNHTGVDLDPSIALVYVFKKQNSQKSVFNCSDERVPERYFQDMHNFQTVKLFTSGIPDHFPEP